jgi:uncharacterized protein (TIGR00290 family)
MAREAASRLTRAGKRKGGTLKRLTAFSSWSGGKDSCHALYRALAEGHEVCALLTMLHEGGAFSRAHGTSRALHERQAEALGLSIHFKSATWEGYEEAFKAEVAQLKSAGIAAGVFGDIDLQEHRDWVEKVCGELAITPLLPLWQEDHAALAREFIGLGFRAVIISVRKGTLPEEWLGRELDHAAIDEMTEMGVDPAGENGEYHTFVYDGPLFGRAVSFRPGAVTEVDGYTWLNLG